MEPRKTSFKFWLGAIALVIIWISPLLATLLTSLKSLEELNQGLYWTIPKKLVFEN